VPSCLSNPRNDEKREKRRRSRYRQLVHSSG
jgi:hypothetical protein